MKKICDKCMDRFMELDKDERLPLFITLHLLKCRECRTQVRYMSLAEKLISIPENTKDNERDVKYLEHPNPVTLTKWIITLILLILSMVTFAIVSSKIESTWLSIAFYIVLGMAISAYSAIFVAQNLDFFIKRIPELTEFYKTNSKA